METETTSSRAWLLDFGKGLRAAVGAHEMSQVLLSTPLYEVPCTPFYANEVFIFEDLIFPMLDVAALVSGEREELQHFNNNSSHVIGLVLYQVQIDEPAHYAGVQLTTLPTNIFVNDDQFCELPERLNFWRPVAVSSFNLNEAVIPIIDLGKLFSGRLTPNDFHQAAIMH
jgi:chemotaxis signal transduction protein